LTGQSTLREISIAITFVANGHSDRVEHEKRAALVRVSVLCRMLAKTLDEVEIEMPTAQLAQELTTLGERAESELSQALEDRY
jgi:hypothetical protein